MSMTNREEMMYILEDVFAELREKSTQLSLITLKDFTAMETIQGIEIDHTVEKKFIDRLQRVLQLGRTYTMNHETREIDFDGWTGSTRGVSYSVGLDLSLTAQETVYILDTDDWSDSEWDKYFYNTTVRLPTDEETKQ